MENKEEELEEEFCVYCGDEKCKCDDINSAIDEAIEKEQEKA